MAKKAVRKTVKKAAKKVSKAAAKPVTAPAPLEPMEKVDPDTPTPTAAGDGLSLYEIEAELTRSMNEWAQLEEDYEKAQIETQIAIKRISGNSKLSEEERRAALAEVDAQFLEYTKEYIKAKQIAEQIVTAYATGSKSKRDNVARYLFSLERKVDNFAVEIKRLQQLKKYAENRHTRVKQTVLDAMSAQGLNRLEGVLHTFTRSNNRASVEITDETAVPWEWRKEPTTPDPDKAAILKHLVASAKVVAAMIHETVGTKPTKVEMGNALETYGTRRDKVPGTRLVTDNYNLRVR